MDLPAEEVWECPSETVSLKLWLMSFLPYTRTFPNSASTEVLPPAVFEVHVEGRGFCFSSQCVCLTLSNSRKEQSVFVVSSRITFLRSSSTTAVGCQQASPPGLRLVQLLLLLFLLLRGIKSASESHECSDLFCP